MIVIIDLLPALTQTFEVIRVDFAPAALVTEHPVEIGAEVTDHVQIRPQAFAAEVMISASPVGIVPAVFPVQRALDFLEQAQGKLLTVDIPGEGLFLSMVLEGWPHALSLGADRSFVLRFKQIRVASALSVLIPPRLPSPIAEVGAPDAIDAGQQAATPGVPPSALLSIGEGATTAIGGVLEMLGFGG